MMTADLSLMASVRQGGDVNSSSGPGVLLDNTHDAYRHEAFFYGHLDQLLDGTVEFIRDALSGDEPIMVALSADKITALRGALGADADAVLFADMAELGRNPGRIISAWHDFLMGAEADGRLVHGIGEPIWPERAAAEIAECQQHEALLNVAFGDRSFRLRCLYNEAALPQCVLDEALRTHPFVRTHGRSALSACYPGDEALATLGGDPLPEPPPGIGTLSFQHDDDLGDVRSFVGGMALQAGLGMARTHDMVLAANEMATNSIRHAGGPATVRAWSQSGSFMCEFRDGGHIAEPLVGRLRPAAAGNGGRGFWMAYQLCDLVQIRVGDAGNVVRLHLDL
jgi:anti-sigma regulatory factor (Ser/Thr protein kinase)